MADLPYLGTFSKRLNEQAKKRKIELEPDRLKFRIQAERAHRSLWEFSRQAWPLVFPTVAFKDNWHIGAICAHLEALFAGDILRLVVNVPPRACKSQLCSVFFFAWAWLRNPGWPWLYVSYNIDLVNRDAMRSKDLIQTKWYQESFMPRWRLREDTQAKHNFVNTAGGQRYGMIPGIGAGVDSAISIMDDPQDIQDARRPRKLHFTADWYDSSMPSRGVDPAKLRRLIVQQRIATKDLSNHVRDKGYEWLILPMEYEPRRYSFSWEQAKIDKVKDPIVPTSVQLTNPIARDPRRQAGELLWPDHLTKGFVADLKRDLRTQYAGQCLQRPSQEGGTIFMESSFRYWDFGLHDQYPDEECVILNKDPRGEKQEIYRVKDCRLFQTADTAFTDKEQNSATAVGTFLFTPRSELLVYQLWQAHLEVPYQYGVLKALLEGPIEWNHEIKKFRTLRKWPLPCLFMAIEPKATGIGLIQQMLADGFPVKTLKTGTGVNKVLRAGPVANMYTENRVYHWRRMDDLGEIENEMCDFPIGGTYDRIDCLSYSGYLATHDKILRSFLQGPLIMSGEDALVESLGAIDTYASGKEVMRVGGGGSVIEVDWQD